MVVVVATLPCPLIQPSLSRKSTLKFVVNQVHLSPQVACIPLGNYKL